MAVHSQEFSYIQPVLDLLDSRVHPYAVYLFGSAVGGNLRADSDIDVAFLTDEKLSGYEQFRLAQEAAERLNREVDLINLGTIETVFRAQIVATGILIVNRDLRRVAEFQIRAFKEYALLNEERASILNRIHDRGSLYDG